MGDKVVNIGHYRLLRGIDAALAHIWGNRSLPKELQKEWGFDKPMAPIENDGKGRILRYPFGQVPPYVPIWDADRIAAYQKCWDDLILRGCVMEAEE